MLVDTHITHINSGKQDDNHIIRANELFFNSRLQIYVKIFSFHAGVEHHFEICKNVLNSILIKN
jgi:hypothetical protein